MHSPSRDEFQNLSRQGNLIPVSREIMADLTTPVSAFIKLAGGDPYAFLLESVEQGEKLGRYSFIGFHPKHIFKCRDNNMHEVREGEIIQHPLDQHTDPLVILKNFIHQFTPVERRELPPFFGGLVGYLGYEMTQHFETLTFQNRDDYNIPDGVFYYADTLVVFDHFQRTMMVIVNAYINDSPEEAYKQACEKIDRIVKILQAPLSEVRFGAGRDTLPDAKTNWSKEEFQNAVDEALEYIRAGDTYQIQVGMRHALDIQSTPLDLYRALRRINPSPYTFFFRYENLCLVGGSPEILIRTSGQEVTYRPIAGTRKRGKTQEADVFLEKELVGDPKEQAEHIMLVDLGRNDIGRVCKFHSVRVTDLMFVERYSHVMHLVSNIVGELRDECDGYDLMRATFPAGTVTGSPKIRSMEIIEELEPTRRGPYAGALGWFGLNGDLDFCITLRTITVLDQTAYWQASAGVVADSNRDFEYQEVMNKCRAMLGAIRMAECSKE